MEAREMTHDELKVAYRKIVIENQIRSHMCKNVNWEIEKLVASLNETSNISLIKQNLRRLQRNHLNYNDPSSVQTVEELLEEYARLTKFTSV